MAEIKATCSIEEHTASDGYRFRYRRYDAAAPRAQVVFVHGIQSHAGWYERSCTLLAQAGFTVTFLDRRKRDTVATVAIARELAGWCWSLATLEQP